MSPVLRLLAGGGSTEEGGQEVGMAATHGLPPPALVTLRASGAHTETGPSPGPWKPASGLLPSPLDNLMEFYFSPLSLTFSQENTVHNVAAVFEVFT